MNSYKLLIPLCLYPRIKRINMISLYTALRSSDLDAFCHVMPSSHHHPIMTAYYHVIMSSCHYADETISESVRPGTQVDRHTDRYRHSQTDRARQIETETRGEIRRK